MKGVLIIARNGENMNNPKIIINEKYQSKEIYFDGKPDENIRAALKSHGFRWNPKKLCWYGFASDTDLLEILGTAATDDALVIPDSSFVDGYGLYDGWQGGKNRTWSSDKELKTFLADDFKKAGIKATIRFNKAGYLTSITCTMTVKESEIIPFEDWKKDKTIGDIYHLNNWVNYTDESGNIQSIWGEKVFGMNREEPETMALYDNILETYYNIELRDFRKMYTVNRIDENTILAPEAVKRYKLMCEIVSSYNRDCSNSMIDYFDRDIYDSYCIKIVA